MKVQFFYDDEPTEVVNTTLFNALRHSSWDWTEIPEEAIDDLTGTFAKVYKVKFSDGAEAYIEGNMLAAIANGEYEVKEELS